MQTNRTTPELREHTEILRRALPIWQPAVRLVVVQVGCYLGESKLWVKVYPVIGIQTVNEDEEDRHYPLVIDLDDQKIEPFFDLNGAWRLCACPWPPDEDQERLFSVIHELKEAFNAMEAKS